MCAARKQSAPSLARQLPAAAAAAAAAAAPQGSGPQLQERTYDRFRPTEICRDFGVAVIQYRTSLDDPKRSPGSRPLFHVRRLDDRTVTMEFGEADD